MFCGLQNFTWLSISIWAWGATNSIFILEWTDPFISTAHIKHKLLCVKDCTLIDVYVFFMFKSAGL